MKRSHLVTLSLTLIAAVTATACHRKSKNESPKVETKQPKPNTNVVPPPPKPDVPVPQITVSIPIDFKIVQQIKTSYLSGDQSLGVYSTLQNQVEKDSVIAGLDAAISTLTGMISNVDASLKAAILPQYVRDSLNAKKNQHVAARSNAQAVRSTVSSVLNFHPRESVSVLPREVAFLDNGLYNEVFFASFDDTDAARSYALEAQKSSNASRKLSTKMAIQDLIDFFELTAASKLETAANIENALLSVNDISLDHLYESDLREQIESLESQAASLKGDIVYLKDALTFILD